MSAPEGQESLGVPRLDARVSVVETRLDDIERTLRSVSGSLDEIGKAVAGIGKTSPSALLTNLGVVAALGAGLWAMAIRPVEQVTVSNRASIATLTQETASAMSDLRADLVHHLTGEGHPATQKMFAEIETQFSAQSQMMNLRYQEQDRLMRMVWRRLYGEDLPPVDYWPHIGTSPISAAGYAP